jgi:tRNA (guanine37-N1)-methyltransferase
MRLDIVTLFPEACAPPLEASIIKRAREQGLVDVRLVNLRDFTHDRHRTVDDRPYGGGAGMVLKPEPLFEAVESLRTPEARVLLLTPQGARFSQGLARDLAGEQHLILVSGHYEGVDERVRQVLVDDEISIGDYVLTNGALPALVVADAVIRLLPGALGCPESAETESFGCDGLLDFPQYTRPVEFRGMRVPDVLISGNHGELEKWRQEQRIVRTAARRPDLFRRVLETENGRE